MGKRKTISIDIETYSNRDLRASGVYRYAESPEFDILLLGYSSDGEPVRTIDLASGEQIPDDIIRDILDDTVIKWAFNASFERICLSSWIKRNHPNLFNGYSSEAGCISYLNPISWRCSMIWSAYMGLPLSLEGAGGILKLGTQKMREGTSLIHYFCTPCRPTSANGGRTRNLPVHDLAKWNTFKQYNIRDVETELAIREKLAKHPVPESVWEEYILDQTINDRGIRIDMEIVDNAMKIDDISRSEIMGEMYELTKLENPNSVSQMKTWLKEKGLETESLGKKNVVSLIKKTDSDIRNILSLRLRLAKSSIKKYEAMKNTVCADGRARGMFQFYGANRSGRWAGRRIQLQNLPQNHLDDLDGARELVRTGNSEALAILFDDIPDTLSQLIRTAFIPEYGCKFIVSDFSAIEARVLAFLSSEKWRMEVFARNGDIYCASASAMFRVPVEKHGQNSHLRQKGKIAELALGYGGSVGALRAMGALEMGLSENELQPLVTSWREANPNIVSFWWNVDAAVRRTIIEHSAQRVGSIEFEYKGAMLYITLPSGRRLSYVKPRIEPSIMNSDAITYEGIGSNKKWGRIESYGPKFVENITQAISRDILAFSMKLLKDMRIVAHVHDELIIECPQDTSLEKVCNTMGTTPPWIAGLVLRADGFEAPYYKKD